MNAVAYEIDSAPTITRDEEAKLYRYLRAQAEGDALRYELIAKKIHRAADGTASEWDKTIVNDWLSAMNELDAARSQPLAWTPAKEEPFSAVRRGQVSAPNYQAFLDTLEQHELDAITSNVRYFSWFSERQAEIKKGGIFSVDYLRRYADQHLSQRVKALRGLP